jgi:hypothetical protein
MVGHVAATGVSVETIEFKGPFGFDGPDSIFNELTDGVDGVYLWCVKIGDSRYRVYYVGEAVDVKNRLSQHRKNFLAGKYSGHCLDSLVTKKVKILMHRPYEGMVPRFSHIDRKSFIERLMANMHLFYAPLPGKEKDGKEFRCRVETGIVCHIENQGQNIVDVRGLRYPQQKKWSMHVLSGVNEIESLSNESFSI